MLDPKQTPEAERLQYVLRRDEWQKDDFIDALKLAGTDGKQKVLTIEFTPGALEQAAAENFGISSLEFADYYGAGM